jgi:hypothetical protein
MNYLGGIMVWYSSNYTVLAGEDRDVYPERGITVLILAGEPSKLSLDNPDIA